MDNNSKQNFNKSVQIVQSSEEVAHQILGNKEELVQLDIERQHDRVGLRCLEKDITHKGKVWLRMGSGFMKMTQNNAKELLKQDMDRLEDKRNEILTNQHTLVNRHRDIELSTPYSGKHLNPLDKKEMDGLRANLRLL